jgi:hypothetical protein
MHQRANQASRPSCSRCRRPRFPQGDSSTRLLLRESLDDPDRASSFWIVWDPMHFVMEKRLLQGDKESSLGVLAYMPYRSRQDAALSAASRSPR